MIIVIVMVVVDMNIDMIIDKGLVNIMQLSKDKLYLKRKEQLQTLQRQIGGNDLLQCLIFSNHMKCVILKITM